LHQNKQSNRRTEPNKQNEKGRRCTDPSIQSDQRHISAKAGYDERPLGLLRLLLGLLRHGILQIPVIGGSDDHFEPISFPYNNARVSANGFSKKL
jgi:hypothetical protein